MKQTNSMKKLLNVLFPTLLTWCFLLFCGGNTYAQQSLTVNGSVVDQTGMPVAGATVLVVGTTNGTISDASGNFILSDVPANGSLQIRFIGFETQVVAVDGRRTINVVLNDEVTMLGEMVVVGYGTRKKSDVTGAMVSVGSAEMTAMPIKNPLQGIQGKAAGVDITSNERPGEVGSIRIRGERSLTATNAPLYVVDGIPLQGMGIENLNPSDIESIDILKDASATAIYGSRGANGVIIVTTKRGKSGKISLNYSSSLSIEKMYDRLEMMNAGEWLNYSRYARTGNPDAVSLAADQAIFGNDPYAWANVAKGWAGGTWDASKVPTYDWTKHGLQTAYTHEHTISGSGGTDKMQAYLSFGYLDQQGTQPGQDYERYTARTSIDITPTKWLKLGGTITTTFGVQNYGYNFRKSTTGASNLYFALQGMLPYAVPYTDEGEYIYLPGGDVNIINPIREADLCVNERESLRAFGSFYTEISILKGLKYRMNFGPDFYYYRNGIFDDAKSINGDGKHTAQYNTQQRKSWTFDNLIYFDKRFNDLHDVGITLLHSASAYKTENSNMTAQGVDTSIEKWYNLYSAGSLSRFGTGLTETQLQSYMARLNYGFNDRYLLTLSGRWDGASQLAEGHKWDFFPSAALAWRVEQEEFMQDFSWLDQLKIRFGVGTTGNAGVNPYDTKGRITPLYYTWGPIIELGQVASDPSLASPIPMANKAMGWEKTTQYNLGVDFSILNNRISGGVDLYQSKTTDLLMAMSINAVTGYISTIANVGSTENKGIDLTLNTINVRSNDITWTTNFTFSADRNKVTALPNGKKEDVANLWFVGKPFGIYYDYVYDGIWKTTEVADAAKYGVYGVDPAGKIRVKDLNKDDVIDANNDRRIVGNRRPKWNAGLLNTVNYKNWELSCFIYSRWGFTLLSGQETLSGRFAQRKLDYWTPTNQDAKYYKPGINGESGDTYKSTMNYQDGSFIKVRNISLGYTFPKNMIDRYGIGNLKLYTQLMNPGLLYSKVDWIDPDLGGSTFNRSLVFGLNIGF